ncbi:MAG: hypothetical protein WCP55_03765 [Lentisphaerota bacterium]
MKKKGIVFGFLLSLLAGIILGVSGGVFLFPKIFPPPPPPGSNEKDKSGGGPPPLTADALREKMMNRLERELDLSAGQKEQVEKEVKVFADELGIFHTGNREKLISMFEAFKIKLAALLSKEQAIRLDRISRGICNPAPPPPPERRQVPPPDERRPPKAD